MRIAKIKENDIANGDGVVVSIWTQGCSHRCNGCHNSSTWDFEGGEFFNNKHKDYVIECMDKNGVQRDLAILGGEPLEECNLNVLCIFLLQFRIHYPNKKIYLWSGYTYEDIIKDEKKKEILTHIDVLIDGKFELDKKDLTLKWRGSSNQRVIDVEKSLSEKRVVLYEKVLTNN